MRPMAPPVPALVAIADTNVLARQACRGSVGGEVGIVAALAGTGRSNIFAGAHVPGELAEHLVEVAASTGADAGAADRRLWDEIMPSIPIVDVSIGDCLTPRARQLLVTDRALPRSMRGDPDDIETVAVAELLAPAVILSADSVFARHGMASTVVDWVAAAHSLMRAAGLEATYADAAFAVELGARLLFFGVAEGVRLAARFPLPALAIAALFAYLAWRYKVVDRDRLRAGARRLGTAAESMAELVNTATGEWNLAREAIFVVEPSGQPTVEQLAARHLARRGRALSPSDLRDELRHAGNSVPAAVLRRAMRAHPAFVRLPGDLYVVGCVATKPVG